MLISRKNKMSLFVKYNERWRVNVYCFTYIAAAEYENCRRDGIRSKGTLSRHFGVCVSYI